MEMGNMFVDDQGIHIRLDGRTVPEVKNIISWAQRANKSANTLAGITEKMAFCWFTIPLGPERYRHTAWGSALERPQKTQKKSKSTRAG